VPAIVLYVEYGLLAKSVSYLWDNLHLLGAILGYGACICAVISLLFFALAALDAAQSVAQHAPGGTLVLRYFAPLPGGRTGSGRDHVGRGGDRVVPGIAATIAGREGGDMTDALRESTDLARLDQVSKWYGPVIAVNHVTARFTPGITGLVGANGAGKSTLIKLLTGQLRPSLGQVRIEGIDAWSPAAKSLIGYCPDVDAFYEEMSGRKFVRTMARFHGLHRREAVQRTEDVLAQVGMTQRADRPLRSYSKGMRQRIKLAQALVPDPKLIVLDEPFNGVDPVGRLDLVRLFRTLSQQGRAILVSSHILDEMDTLADRVLFMCRGRLLASGTLPQIRALLDDHPRQIRIRADRTRVLASRLLELDSVQGAQLTGADELLLEVTGPQSFYESLARIVVQESIQVERMITIDASTEAVFRYLMQRARRF
jgi:ABC-2 type transport system ATP-binding protein